MIGATDAETLVRQHMPWMLLLAERILQDHSLAQDVVQDAFLSAFKSYVDFDHRSSIKTWLHRITVNAALMTLRQQKRRAELPFEEETAEFDEFGCRIAASWGRLPGVEELVATEQRRALIRQVIDALPDNYRIVLLLRDIEGYSIREVAGLLEVSESNVKIRLHRARAALKTSIEPLLREVQS